jgi:hypothetical protein
MQFPSARPDIIRAINQRWLFKHWNESRGSRALPEWHALEGREFDSMCSNLSFIDVVATDSHPRFLIRYHGARIGEAYGSDCHGKHLDEILPANFRDAALATYWQVVETRHPVYTAVDTPDRDGRIVHYERLLLPFGRDGVSVDRILASLEMVSLDGGFHAPNLMTSGKTPSRYAVCVTIPPFPA